MKTTARRAAIYARYSSELQHDRSVDDQFELARAHAAREGLQVVDTFADRAKSGASLIDRGGLLDLMHAAKAGAFDVVLVESLDRLSRDQEDLAGLYKRLSFFKVEVRTVHEGVATPIHVGLRGLIGQIYLSDLAQKVRRGHAGRLREGKIPGQFPYGYRYIPTRPGEPELHPDHAAIVRRIFEEYAAGLTPKAITTRLNAEGVPSPRGGQWDYTNFVKSRSKDAHAYGLLRNRTYIGEIVWNRQRRVINPETGREIVEMRPQSEWTTVHKPELRIVPQDLWDAVQAMIQSRSRRCGGDARGPKIFARNDSFLAGLLRCGCCGAGMVISHKEKSGVRRIACSSAFRYQQCENGKSYELERLERMAVDFVSERLADAELIAEFAEAYRDERQRLEREFRREAASVTKRLNEVQGAILRLVNALERGSMPEDQIISRLQALETERAALAERKRLAGEHTNVVTLHADAVELYKAAMVRLRNELLAGTVSTEVRMAFRNLIAQIDVHKTGKRKPYEIAVSWSANAVFGVELFPERRTVAEIAEENGVALATATEGETFRPRPWRKRRCT